MLLIYSVTYPLFHLFIKKFTSDEFAIWYLLHVYCNLVMIFLSIPLIIDFFQEPLKSLTNNREYDIHNYAIVPHIYHCIAFNINNEDIFHHVSFVFFGMLMKKYMMVGNIIGLYLFFITGLPGAIDYFLLFLYRTNYITKKTRHKLAVYLNSWIRCPGLIFSNSIFICYILINYTDLYKKIISIICSLYLWSFNGLYYNYRVRDSYIKKISIK